MWAQLEDAIASTSGLEHLPSVQRRLRFGRIQSKAQTWSLLHSAISGWHGMFKLDGAALEKGCQPLLAAPAAGIILWSSNLGLAAAAMHQGTQVGITVAGATFQSSAFAAMMGDSMEAMLALCVHPLYALVAPVTTALAISVGQLDGDGKCGGPLALLGLPRYCRHDPACGQG